MDKYIELQKHLFCTQLILFNYNLQLFNFSDIDKYILFNKKIIKRNNKYAFVDSGYIDYISFYLIYNNNYLNLWFSMENLFKYFQLNNNLLYILNQKIYNKKIINKNNINISDILINKNTINISYKRNKIIYFKQLIQLYINKYKNELINNNFYNFKKEKAL